MSSIQIDPKKVSEILERNAQNFAVKIGPEEIGKVIDAGDGIARVDGLPGAMAEEMLQFPGDIFGMAMNLDRHDIGTIILGDFTHIQQGDTVHRTGKVLQVPVGEQLLGRVVDPLGQPVDGKGPIISKQFRCVEVDAPGIVDRLPVNRPLQTGLKCIDSMTAIGRGQRELIIGDRQTGKTTVAIDTILNQARGDVFCVYVAIGQKMSNVAAVVEVFRKHHVLDNVIIVAATASDSAPMQFIAPFAGCSMAEYFRDSGRDALIVYDDLYKHAVAYREISLLLRRPPGREAYPGDIFYLHSRLLERAVNFSKEKGGGSLTALPIVETQQGDYSAYVPTNLISITDGQIYLQPDLFYAGFRPAINSGLSVSRVGGKAQTRAMKKVALRVRLDLAQYREVLAFSQLTSDLDAATAHQILRGERLAEVLKQPLNAPMSMEKQVCVLWSVINGHMDNIAMADIARFERELLIFIDAKFPVILKTIRETGDLADGVQKNLVDAMQAFKQSFVSRQVTAQAKTPGQS